MIGINANCISNYLVAFMLLYTGKTVNAPEILSEKMRCWVLLTFEEGDFRMASIGANIKARRRALGMNQEELARKLGVTQANISRIESSVKGLSSDMLLPIASALSCDVRELLGLKCDDKTELSALGEDARTFVTRTLENDPQLALYLRSFVKDQDSFTEEDWKFLASSLRLALGYAVDAIKTRRVREGF